MMLRIQITLTDDDLTVMHAIQTYIRTNRRTPKKREIVTTRCLPMDFKATRAERVFERLKLIGVIDHNINGHCCLTPEGKRVYRKWIRKTTVAGEQTGMN